MSSFFVCVCVPHSLSFVSLFLFVRSASCSIKSQHTSGHTRRLPGDSVVATTSSTSLACGASLAWRARGLLLDNSRGTRRRFHTVVFQLLLTTRCAGSHQFLKFNYSIALCCIISRVRHRARGRWTRRSAITPTPDIWSFTFLTPLNNTKRNNCFISLD